VCRDSVTFIALQYVLALRERGVDAGLIGLRGGDVAACRPFVRPRASLATCDVLVSNLFLPDLAASMIRRARPRMRWVSLLHCNMIVGMLGEKKVATRERIGLWRRALAGADAILSPSAYAAKGLSGGPAIIRLPHALVPEIEARFRGEPGTGRAQPASSRWGDPTYVFIGRDTRTKRLYSMVRLLRADRRTHIRLITRIEHSAAIIDSLDASERARCELIGYSANPYDHVSPADIIVCPSGREGFGLVPLEALARGFRPAMIREGAFAEYWEAAGLCYDRIEDLPSLPAASERSIGELRQRFIGWPALQERTDVLLDVISGRLPTSVPWFLA